MFNKPLNTLTDKNEPPQGDAMARSAAQSEKGRGAPPENYTRNDSLPLVVKDKNFSEKNSDPTLFIVKDKNFSEKNSENFDDQSLDVPRETGLLEFKAPPPLSPLEVARSLRKRLPYKEEYLEYMISYFMEREKYRETIDTYTWKTGEVSEKIRNVPNPPPSFSEFGRKIGASETMLKSWCKKNKVFAEAYEICQSIIQEFFVENGVRGDYVGQFAIFAAKNLTKMKDVQVNKNENYDMKSILDALEKGSITSDELDVN